MRDIKRFVAGGLRAVAGLLDPQPPHMQSALRLLGWGYDGAHWVYYSPGHVPLGEELANANPARDLTSYYWPEGPG